MSDAVEIQHADLPQWRVLLVEDDLQMRQDVLDHLSEIQIADRSLTVSAFDFADALTEIAERRADLIILDVFRGSGFGPADAAGLNVLSEIQSTGFVSVILYTAHPEKVAEYETHFVRLVGKEANSLDRLTAVAEELFTTRIPQIFRGITEHMQSMFRDYMWQFVDKNWGVLEPLSGKPEFLRLVLSRLGASLSGAGVARLSASIFDGHLDGDAATGMVHPAEYYVMPPMDGASVKMGDLRIRTIGETDHYLVVLWPSCDMVRSETRQPKTDRVICAAAELITTTAEVQKYKEGANTTKEKAVQELLKNKRHGNSERFHFLPGLCDVPDLLVDFQKLEVVALAECTGFRCPATVASPFAESISSRFLRYIGRIGTPDLDLSLIMGRL